MSQDPRTLPTYTPPAPRPSWLDADSSRSDLHRRIASEEKVDPDLVDAIRGQEGTPEGVTSGAGAQSSMQVIPATGLQYVTADEWKTTEGKIRAGVRYLRHLTNRYGIENVDQIAAGYHAGEGAVDAAIAAGKRLPHTEDKVVSAKRGKPFFTDVDYVPGVVNRYKKKPTSGTPAPKRPAWLDEPISTTAPAAAAVAMEGTKVKTRPAGTLASPPSLPTFTLGAQTPKPAQALPGGRATQNVSSKKLPVATGTTEAAVDDTEALTTERPHPLATASGPLTAEQREQIMSGPEFGLEFGGATPAQRKATDEAQTHYSQIDAVNAQAMARMSAQHQADLRLKAKREALTREDVTVRRALHSPEKVAADLEWHFGKGAVAEMSKLPVAEQRRMVLIASAAAQRDADKKIADPSFQAKEDPAYQAKMRTRIKGLPSQPATAPQQGGMGVGELRRLEGEELRGSGMSMGELRRREGAEEQFSKILEEETNRTVMPGDASFAERLAGRGLPPEVAGSIVNSSQGPPTPSLLQSPGEQAQTQATRDEYERAKRAERLSGESNKLTDRLREESTQRSALQRVLRILNPITSPDALANEPLVHVATAKTGPAVAGELSNTAADLLHFVDTLGGNIEGNRHVSTGIKKLRDLASDLQAQGNVIPKGGVESAVQSGAEMVAQGEKFAALKAVSGLPFWAVMGAEAALRTQDQPISEQAKAVPIAILTGLAIDYGPGLVVKGLGKMPGAVGALARRFPIATGTAVTAGAFGATAAEETKRRGGSTAEAIGAGVGAAGAVAALSLTGTAGEVRDLGRQAIKTAIASEKLPETAKDFLATVLKYGKGVVVSDDGRAASLYADKKTGDVFGNELTPEELKNYDPSVVTGEKRPVRNRKNLTAEEYDRIVETLGIKTAPVAKGLPPAPVEADPAAGRSKPAPVMPQQPTAVEPVPEVATTQPDATGKQTGAATASTSTGVSVFPNTEQSTPSPSEIPAPQSETPLSLIERYENEGDLTISDVVNEIEGVSDNPKIAAAIRKYREEQAYDRELKGRGDMESAENEFLASVRSVSGVSVPEGKPLANVPHQNEVEALPSKLRGDRWAFFRIQDERSPLPERSRSAWTGSESEQLDGVSAYSQLLDASRDLLSGKDVDGVGINYAADVRDQGGKPVLSVFGGRDLGDESPNVRGWSVEPERPTETRFTTEHITQAWRDAVSKEFPEDRTEIQKMSFRELDDTYELSDNEIDAYHNLRVTVSAKPATTPKGSEGGTPIAEPPAKEASTTGLTEGFKYMGGAISVSLYRGMFERMEAGKLPAPFPAANQPAFEQLAKKEYDAGRVKSWHDLWKLANPGKPEPASERASEGLSTAQEIWDANKPVKLLGTDARLSTWQTYDDISYEMYRTEQGLGIIRVFDNESRNVVELIKYPNPEQASKAFREATEIAQAGGSVELAAHEAAHSPLNDLAEPTPARQEAGNYRKGHIRVSGLDISVENPEGSERKGVDPSGKPWSITMQSHYGYLKRSKGADDEHVDFFIKPGTPANYDGPIFVVNQTKANGQFDEHKVMLGWESETSARSGYAENYTKGWKVGEIVKFDNPDQFKDWLKDEDTTKPAVAPGEQAAPKEMGAGDEKQRFASARKRLLAGEKVSEATLDEFPTLRKLVKEQPAEVLDQRDEESGMRLSQAVRRAGGIKFDMWQGKAVNRGELASLTKKEGGTAGLINNKGGRTVEDMAKAMAVEGYGAGSWADPDDVKGFEVDFDGFINALEADASGREEHYSTRFQPDTFDDEYGDYLNQQFGSDLAEKYAKSADALMSMMENDGAGELLGRVISGLGEGNDETEFRRLAKGYGVIEKDINAIVKEGRAAAKGVPDVSTSEGEGIAEPAIEPDRPKQHFAIEVNGQSVDVSYEHDWLGMSRHDPAYLKDHYEFRGTVISPTGYRSSFDLAPEVGVTPEMRAQEIAQDLADARSKDVAKESRRQKKVSTGSGNDRVKAAPVPKPAQNVLSQPEKVESVDVGEVEAAVDDWDAVREDLKDSGVRAVQQMYENAQDLVDRIVTGKAGKKDVDRFYEVARGYGVKESDIEAILDQGGQYPLTARGFEDEPGTSQAPAFSVEGNQVKLENATAARVLTDAYAKAEPSVVSKRAVVGAFENGERLARMVDALGDRAGASELATAIRTATKSGEGRVVVYYGENVRAHEMFHETSAAANRYLQDRHADLQGLTAHPLFGKVREALIDKGYPNDNGTLVEEAAAYIAEGRYGELNLTAKEAVDWLSKWFESFAKKNGRVTIEKFRELSDEAEKARTRVYESYTEGAAQSPSAEAVSGVEGAREARHRKELAARAAALEGEPRQFFRLSDDVPSAQHLLFEALYRARGKQAPPSRTRPEEEAQLSGSAASLRQEGRDYIAPDGTRFTGKGGKSRAERYVDQQRYVGATVRSYGGGLDVVEKVEWPDGPGLGSPTYTVRDEAGRVRQHRTTIERKNVVKWPRSIVRGLGAYGSIERPDVVALSKEFAFHFTSGKRFATIIEARRFAADLLGSERIEAGSQATKKVDEAVELGAVRAARVIVDTPRLSEVERFRKLVDLYHRQPTLGARTSTSMREQAYSTPPPLGFVASRLSGISDLTTVYDPAAGNGALLIEANPDKTTVNEINEDRYQNLRSLGFGGMTEDATEVVTTRPVDVVIANPPFGVVREGQRSKVFRVDAQYSTNEIDHAIALKALESMKDRGRATLIVASVKGDSGEARSDQYNGKAKREFYKTLYDAYNVVDQFTVSGNLYRKQGAAWPVDVIVIDGRGKSALKLPAVDVPRVYDSWETLGGIFDAKYNRRLETEPRSDTESSQPESGRLRDRGSDRGLARPEDGPRDLFELAERSPTGAGGQVAGPSGQPDLPVRDSGRNEPGSSAIAGAPEPGGSRNLPERSDEGVPLSDRGAGRDADETRSGRRQREAVAERDDTGKLVERADREAGGVGQPKPSITSIFDDSQLEAIVDSETAEESLRRSAEAEIARRRAAVEAERQQRAADDEAATAAAQETRRARPRERVEAGATQTAYQPASKATSLNAKIPVNMKHAVEESLDRLVAQHGDVDRYVARVLNYDPAKLSEYFLAEQVDAIALALNALEKDEGFIIGDQGGIGKGRVVAAIIKYGIINGRPVIFVTEKPNLFKDIVRDLTDIGEGSVRDWAHRAMMTNFNEKVPLDDDETVFLKTGKSEVQRGVLQKMMEDGDLGQHQVIFTTYAQMQTVQGAETIRQKFLKQFAGSGAILVMDESHNAGGQEEKKKKKLLPGEEPTQDRAELARDLVGRAHGVFYSSATYAKRPGVMDLYAKTDMSKAVDDPKQLADTIARGGVPLQQVVASMLAEAGQYIRRERDFEGMTYQTTEVPVDVSKAEDTATAMRAIKVFDELKQEAVEHIKDDLKQEAGAVLHDNAVGNAGVHSTNFTALMHNLIAQLTLMMKADGVAEMALEKLKAGEKPVITVANTMGAFIEDYAKEYELKPGQAIDLNFGDMLKRYLERSRDITIGKAFSKDRIRRRLTDDELGKEAVEAYKRALNTIRDTDWSGLPVSPIDYITAKLNRAGYKGGEITGRKHIIDYSSTRGNPIYRTRPGREVSILGRTRTLTGFNNGLLHFLILNQAGASGLSVHSSSKFRDQRKRHMLIAQAELNIDTFMQLLYRIDRTGQVVKPSYSQVVANIPAEKRPAAVLQKKMASLNANTTAAKGSAYQAKDVPDFMNDYGDEVVAQVMEDNPEIHRQLGKPLKDAESGEGLSRKGAIRKVTGRIPLLKMAEQERIYDVIEEEYAELIQRLDAMGENDLDAKTLDLQAKSLSKVEVFEGKGTSPFAKGAYAETMDIRRMGKPFTTEQVLEQIGLSLKSASETYADLQREGQAAAGKLSRTMRAKFDDYMREEVDSIADVDRARANRAKLDEMWGRWEGTANLLAVGQGVEVTSAFGVFNGIVTRLEQKGSPKNPVALGTWRATIALADSVKQITIPFSKVYDSSVSVGDVPMTAYQVRTEPIASIRSAGEFKRTPVIKAFNEAQTQAREHRIMMTGNLLAGFARFRKHRGRIVHFTDSEGQVKQGILMPQKFDLAEALKEEGVAFSEAKDVLQFLDDGNGSRMVETPDHVLRISFQRGKFRFTVPAARSVGGAFYLNRKLLDVAGDEFVKSGSTMQMTLTTLRAGQVVRALFDQRIKLITDSYKEEARKLTGNKAKRHGEAGFLNLSAFFPATGEPRQTFSFLTSMQTRFVRGGAQIRAASEKSYEAMARAAGSRAQAAVISSVAAAKITKELGGKPEQYHEFLAAGAESRLRGVQQRWTDLGDTIRDADDEETESAYESGMRSVFQRVISHSFFDAERDMLGDVLAYTDSLAAGGHWAPLRNYLGDAFDIAATNVAHISFDGTADWFERFTAEPRFGKALEIYKREVETPASEAHALNEGVFSDALGPLDTWFPLIPVQDDGTLLSRLWSGRSQFKPYKKPENVHNRMATGLAERYDLTPEHLHESIGKVLLSGNTAHLLNTLEEEGLTKRIKPGVAYDRVINYNGVEYKATPVAITDPRTIYKDKKVIHVPGRMELIPNFVKRELKVILEGDFSDGARNGLIQTINFMGMVGPLDAVFHSDNVIGSIVAGTPFVGTSLIEKTPILNNPLTKKLNGVINILRTDPFDNVTTQELMRAARLGVLSDRYASDTYSRKFAKMTGAKWKPYSFGPALYGPKGLDTRGRLLMLRIADAYAPDASDTEIIDFISQLGMYTKGLQSEFERTVKYWGLAPFFTAGSTMLRNGIRVWTGGAKFPDKTLSPAERNKWRLAGAFGGGAIGLLALWMILHKLYRGKWPIQENDWKLLQIKLKPEDRKRRLAQSIYGHGDDNAYVGISFLSPLVERGARALGISGALEAATQGGSGGQMAERAERDAINSLIHPVTSGPALHAAWTTLTGAEPYLAQTRDPITGRFKWGLKPAIGATEPGLPTYYARAREGFLSWNNFNQKFSSEVFGIGHEAEENAKRDADGRWIRMIVDLAIPRLIKGTYNRDKRANQLAKERKAATPDPVNQLRSRDVKDAADFYRRADDTIKPKLLPVLMRKVQVAAPGTIGDDEMDALKEAGVDDALQVIEKRRPVEKELQHLGLKFPQVDRKLKIGPNTHTLSDDEYEHYQARANELFYSRLPTAIASDEYKQADPLIKNRIITDVEGNARALASAEMKAQLAPNDKLIQVDLKRAQIRDRIMGTNVHVMRIKREVQQRKQEIRHPDATAP